MGVSAAKHSYPFAVSRANKTSRALRSSSIHKYLWHIRGVSYEVNIQHIVLVDGALRKLPQTVQLGVSLCTISSSGL